jgi:hypothetical protein
VFFCSCPKRGKGRFLIVRADSLLGVVRLRSIPSVNNSQAKEISQEKIQNAELLGFALLLPISFFFLYIVTYYIYVNRL